MWIIMKVLASLLLLSSCSDYKADYRTNAVATEVKDNIGIESKDLRELEQFVSGENYIRSIALMP